jgi:hypothetical protein
MARPTKLTPDTQAKIVNALTAGNTRSASVAYAGINFDTFCQWMKFSEFSEAGFC